MVEKFDAAGVAEQKKHKFDKWIHTFTHAPKQTPTLIDRLEIHPASMVPQRGVATPFPGSLLVAFVPEATKDGRVLVREKLREALPVTIDGRDDDILFKIWPTNGVVTHQLVQQALTTLYKTEAINAANVQQAASAYNTASPDISGIPLDTPLTTRHYDPQRPKNEQRVAQLATELFRRP